MTTICKYFLTNSCRYGDRCRFSHSLPNQSNPYVYDARTKNAQSGKDEVERLLPEYLKRIAEDTNQIEQQQMWPLTCYSFAKSQGNLPDWNDISMEELRWEAYQAQNNGTSRVYVANVQNLLSHAKEVRSLYLRPSEQAKNILREYMNGKHTMALSSNQSTPFFMNSSYKPPQTNFSFASAFENAQPTSVFNQATTNPSGRFFNQNVQSNTFKTQITSQSSQPFFGFKNSFETSQSTTGIFRTTPFQQDNSNMEMSTVCFPQSSPTIQFPTSTFQFSNKLEQNQTAVKCSVNNVTYSKVEDLSEEDREAFKAPTFTLENLPFLPPPEELCH